MNPPDFTGSSVNEDPENFVEDLQKVFDVIHVADAELQKSSANRSSFQHKPNGLAPSSASAPTPRNKGEFKNQNLQNFRARPAQSQGNVAQRECPKNRKGNGNGGNRAQSSLVALPDRVAPRGATSGTCRGANHLYAITSC
ncbi:uncharacterized protein LOC125807273 [Solanum verrucosum]|uniref:uncharacterized protein LOC125807273 n=1 Tax=Solanum verrucosum TaxID=315347 RepID=UPI0020D0D97C|nr:uncharacterized protein LOC125807273 [Solanum verrucosum]